MDPSYKLILLETASHLLPFGRIFGIDLDPFYQECPHQLLPIEGDSPIKISVLNELVPRRKLIYAAHMLHEDPAIERILIVDRFTEDCRNPKIYSIGNATDFYAALGNVQLSEHQKRKIEELLFAPQHPMTDILRLYTTAVNITIRPADIQLNDLEVRTRPEQYRKRLKLEEEEEEEEEKEVEDACCVCMTREKTVMLVPCQHQVLCDYCADKIMEDSQKCPVCRKEIRDLFRPQKI